VITVLLVAWIGQDTVSRCLGKDQNLIAVCVCFVASCKVDKSDHGAFRFTDIDRNLLVASTDLPGISKTPLQTIESTMNRRLRPATEHETEKAHYSGTGQSQVWGTDGVYKDNMVNNEIIRLELLYKRH
jgi:hypothetical protein